MQLLPASPLPLPRTSLTDYAWSEREFSELSTTTAFNTGLNERDTFLGQCCCIICGSRRLKHCHIIPKSEPDTWSDLKDRGWLPQLAKDKPHHEPRNGLTLCKNHRALFEGYEFFIRFFPNAKKYVLINYSDQYFDDLQPYHGKAIALDIADKRAPFPSIFVIHEMRVRGYRPFHDTSPDVPNDNAINWQDWVITSGVWDNAESQFRRHGLHTSGATELPQMPSMTTSGSGEPSASGTRRLELNEKVVADILAATRAMPSWKECEMDGTRWTGTAEENTQKYLS